MNKLKTIDVGAALRKNPLPGFGVVTGLSKNGKYAVVACFVTGAEAEDRNWVFNNFGDEIMLMPRLAGLKPSGKPVISSPIKKQGNHLIVGDGTLTDALCGAINAGTGCYEALCGVTTLPDTAVGAVLNFAGGYRYGMFAVTPNAEGKNDVMLCSPVAVPGVAHMYTTLGKGGKPVSGEPIRVSALNGIDAFTNKIWEALGTDVRAALAVRYISLASGRVNTRTKDLY